MHANARPPPALLLPCLAVDVISNTMSDASTELQGAMCFLVTALAAFNEASHSIIMNSGLVPKLVMLCRSDVSGWLCMMGANQRHAERGRGGVAACRLGQCSV